MKCVRFGPGLRLWMIVLWVCIGSPFSIAIADPNDIGRAEHLYEQELHDSAQIVLDSILASDSADVAAWMLRSRIHAARREWTARQDALRRIQSEVQYYPNLTEYLTESFLQMEMIDSAATYLEQLPRRRRMTEPFPLFLHAWLLEAQGRYDSAVTVYRRVFRTEEAGYLVKFPIGTGTRLGAITLLDHDHRSEQLFPGVPTVFLFWRTGFDASETALNDIAVQSPKAGIEWRFVPVHVGSSDSLPADPTQRAREHDYEGAVWLDPDLRLFQRLGLTRVPTIIFSGINGEVDQILQDWSESIRDKVFERRFGNYTDTVPTPGEAPDLATLRPNRVLARAQATWNAGQTRDALRALGESVLKHPAHLLSRAQLADWRWRLGDTPGARVAAHQALALDSLNTWSLLVVAEIARRQQNSARAIGLLQQCVSIDPEFVRGWISLGVEAALSGDSDLARDALVHLRRLDTFDRRLPILVACLTNGDSKARVSSWHRAIRRLLR